MTKNETKNSTNSAKNPFEVLEFAVELTRRLRGPLEVIGRHDRDLAGQARRAATSVPLNVAEGNRRVGRDRLHAWRVAMGSADEVRVALRVAEAWGYLAESAAAPAAETADRVIAILYRLTHPR